MNCDLISEQDRQLVSQLDNARYASLTNRAVTDPANNIVDVVAPERSDTVRVFREL